MCISFVEYPGTYMMLQGNVQCTHGTKYNLKFSLAFSPRFVINRCIMDKVINLIFLKTVNFNQAEHLQKTQLY